LLLTVALAFAYQDADRPRLLSGVHPNPGGGVQAVARELHGLSAWYPGASRAELAGTTLAGPPAAEELATLAGPDPETLEQALLEQTNADRVANGLQPLVADPDMLVVARTRAVAQVPLPRLSHYDAAGRAAVADLLAAAGARYRLAGENLARVPGDPQTAPARAAAALLDSPAHRANILEPAFDRLAVGATIDGQGRVVFAQIFRQAGQ
jgi:uncharacterized protein YkwD